jgi:hypothetical protein
MALIALGIIGYNVPASVQCAMALYADSGSGTAPGAYKTATNGGALANGPNEQGVLNSGMMLTGGTQYWIAAECSGDGYVCHDGSTIARPYYQATPPSYFSDPMPWTSSGMVNSPVWSFYLVGTE